MLCCLQVQAQITQEGRKVVDSLKRVVKTPKNDTTLVRALAHWDQYIYLSDPGLDFELNERIEKICERNLKKKLSKKERDWFNAKYCECLNNLGLIYRDLGNYGKAILHYEKSLKIARELNLKDNISNSLNNIGIVYIDTKENDKAVDYLQQSLKLSLELGDSSGVATSYNNIGIIYLDRKEIEKAYEYHKKSLEIRQKIGERSGVAASLMNIGLYYQEKKEYIKAIEHFTSSLVIAHELENQKLVASAACYLGLIYREKGDMDEAIKYFEIGLINAQEGGEALMLLKASKNLSELYEKKGRLKEAIEEYKMYVEIKDSIANIDSKKEALRLEFKHEYEKKAAADSVHNVAEKKISDTKLEQIRAQRKYLYIIIVLAVLFAGFIFSRLRITHRQKNIIEEQKKTVEQQKDMVEVQKHFVEEKQREVMDSIHYAKRIQEALLPSKKYIDKNLKRLNE